MVIMEKEGHRRLCRSKPNSFTSGFLVSECATLVLTRTSTSTTGYLQKKAKTGKWQKRWFETNAHYLTYYKVSPHCDNHYLLSCRNL